MLYLVKYSDTDYRFYEESGAEISSWTDKPDKTQLMSALDRGWRLMVEGYAYRDVAEHGSSEVPFDL